MGRSLLRLISAHALVATAPAAQCDWWYETTVTHGWNFRNVSTFGAKGDGVHDDTAAIQAAISSNRGGDAGSNADKSSATVYVPPGTYVITDTIVLWKWTKLFGNPRCPPTFIVPPSTPAFSGAGGLRPVFVTNGGFNVSADARAWWLEGNDAGGMTYDYFFTQLHDVGITVGAGNPGAVAITWNVAQQTSIRSVTIAAAPDVAIALDVGASSEYEHWNAGVPYNLGGGGTVEDVTITGAKIGLRVGASQFVLRGVRVRGSSVVGVQVWQLTWAISFLQLDVADAPVGVLYDTAQGVTVFADCNFSGIGGPAVFATDDASPLVLQNVQITTTAANRWVVNGALPVSNGSSNVVPSWARGDAFFAGGTERNASTSAAGGPLPLPSESDASAQGIPLVCVGSDAVRPHLCGGSAEDASTGIPVRPRPVFDEGGRSVLNARSFGAVGDGVTDDTRALQAALAAAGSHGVLFIPFGIYVISDTLHVPPSGRVIGEGLTVLILNATSPGFGPSGGGFKPVLLVDANASSVVWLADLSLWNAYCGNGGAVMIAWGAGPGSGMWDVNMLISATVGAKMVVAGEGAGAGAGYISNGWFAASMAYIPMMRVEMASVARAAAAAGAAIAGGGEGAAAAAAATAAATTSVTRLRAEAVESQWRDRIAVMLGSVPAAQRRQRSPMMPRTRARGTSPFLSWDGALESVSGDSAATVADSGASTASVADSGACDYTPIGVLVASEGPFFWVGVNFEHSIVAELGFLPDTANHVVFMVETEESERALTLNGTRNVVLYNGLFAFWNASIPLPAQIIAQRPHSSGGPPPTFDLSYRIIGAGVPLPGSETDLLLDVSDGGRGFAVPVGALSTGYSRAAAVLLSTAPTYADRRNGGA